MSRKVPTKAAPVPSRVRAETLLRSGHILEALEVSKEICARAPNADNIEHRKQIFIGAIDALIDANKPIAAVLEEAEKFVANDPAWIRTRAGWLARTGKLEQALARVSGQNNPADATHLTHLAVDQAVRQKSPAILPAEHHAGLMAILAAFQQYEAGEDEKAREALQPIGLSSPFLDWKVFLRGLIAFANQDHSRAIENWDRLDPTRLATRLVSPIRVGIDPAYRDSLPEIKREELRKRSERLNEGNLLQGLREIRRNLSRDGSLPTAFREVSGMAMTLKRLVPDLFQRLADIFYHTIIHHGRPEDLARFRTTFGPPADDPMFDRLEALVYEGEMAHAEAHKHWQKYARWLSSPPAGWNQELAQRACAIIWFRMATNAHRAEQTFDSPLFDEIARMLVGNKKIPRLNIEPDTATCLKHAIEAAPEWSEPTQRMMQVLGEAKKFTQLEKVANEFLERHPNDLTILTEFAKALLLTRQFAKATQIWEQALALQPLDETLRVSRNYSIIADFRQRSTTADARALRAELDTKRSALTGTFVDDLQPLDATLALKAGQKDEAEAVIAQLLAKPEQRLAGPYRLLVEASLAKLKPSQKTQATRRFKEAMATEPTPKEVTEILMALGRYQAGGFEYHGIKTHIKQILALVPRCTQGDYPVTELGPLANQLEVGGFWKELGKFAIECQGKFPRQAAFLYYEALGMFHTKKHEYAIEQKLRKAKKLAEEMPPESRKFLMQKIDGLLEEVKLPPMNDLFGPGFGGPDLFDSLDDDEYDDD